MKYSACFLNRFIGWFRKTYDPYAYRSVRNQTSVDLQVCCRSPLIATIDHPVYRFGLWYCAHRGNRRERYKLLLRAMVNGCAAQFGPVPEFQFS